MSTSNLVEILIQEASDLTNLVSQHTHLSDFILKRILGQNVSWMGTLALARQNNMLISYITILYCIVFLQCIL